MNIAVKTRSNLFPWNGQFSPQLIQVLLETYADSSRFVLDPFMGSGTVLCEAARLGIQACGTDINPAACIMAQVYRLINASPSKREQEISALEGSLDLSMPSELPLLGEGGDEATEDVLKSELIELHESLANGPPRWMLQTLIVLLDFYRPGLSSNRVYAIWGKLKHLVRSLPHSEAPIVVANCDARTLPTPDHVVDLVATSPPYINVFNYHQQFRKSVEALKWDVLSVARSEFGSNRKHRGNRFLTVTQYCLDIASALVELRRTCRDSARIIFVVGRESNVRKTPFYNGEIVAELGVLCADMKLESRQERVFRNRFGNNIYEDILHFTIGDGDVPTPPVSPRDIARQVLEDAIARAPRMSLDDLQSAVSLVDQVEPSPNYSYSENAPTRSRTCNFEGRSNE